MPVPVQSPEIAYTANGVTTVFAYPFLAFAAADLRVRIDGTLAVLNVDYTVTGVGVESGGTVIFGVPPSNGANVTIQRRMPLGRDIEYQYSGDFQSPTVNRDFDRLWMSVQDIDQDVSRSLHFPVGDPADTTVPSLSERALKGLAFDVDGNLIAAPASDATSLAAALVEDGAGDAGAGIVGFDDSNTYPPDTVGATLKDVSEVTTDITDMSDPAKGSALVGFKSSAASSVGRTSQSKMDDILNPFDFGVAGDGTTDDTTKLQSAINASAARKSPLNLSKSYLVSSPLTVPAGAMIEGSGSIKLASAFAGASAMSVTGQNVSIRGITIDGTAAVSSSSSWYGGIHTSGDVSGLVVDGCNILHTRFNGVWVADHTSQLSAVRVVNNRIEDVGWVGIHFEGTDGGLCSGNQISRAGYDGIRANACSFLRIAENYVTKASAPTVIYSGPGSNGGVEKGMLILLAPDLQNVTVSGNVCIDNRTAAEDGIGLGEDGVSEHKNISIVGNVVKYAGLFGIDVPGNCSIVGNVIEQSADVGIYLGLDLGGPVRNAAIVGNTVKNIGSSGSRYGILLAHNQSSSNAFSEISIVGNTVTDDRGTQYLQYGIGFSMTNATFSNILVSDNNLAKVGTRSVNIYGSGGTPTIDCRDNKLKSEVLSVTGTSFSAVGGRLFEIGAGSPTNLMAIVNGVAGQQITVRFTDGNYTLAPDWTNTNGLGVNRIVGNGNASRAMAAGDAAILTYTGQYWLAQVVDAY